MDLTGSIKSAELQYQHILEEFFTEVFNGNTLSSHNIDHHGRVWRYAKELLILLAEENRINDTTFPSRLIMACFIHDIGMSVDAGTKHGKLSRDLCIRFFMENGINPENYTDVLSAIENHDNKEYNYSSSADDLLRILSAADDLDAFGYIGIFRYLEIYLVRRTPLKIIGKMIRANASGRFRNFESAFCDYPVLIVRQKERFMILDEFFNRYNQQVRDYKFNNENPAGYCGVAEIVSEMVRNKVTLNELFYLTDRFSNDLIISNFIVNMQSETLYHMRSLNH